MRDERIKRDYYWVVEAADQYGRINFRKEYYTNDERAVEDYNRLKANGTVSIQRRYKEYKVA